MLISQGPLVLATTAAGIAGAKLVFEKGQPRLPRVDRAVQKAKKSNRGPSVTNVVAVESLHEVDGVEVKCHCEDQFPTK